MTDESRPTPPAHADPPPPPRRNPALYGAGLGTTIAGSVAVPVGFTVIMVGVADSLGQVGCFDASCRHTSSGADRTTTGNGTATLIYSGSASRWLLINFDP